MVQRLIFISILLILSGCVSKRDSGPTPDQTKVAQRKPSMTGSPASAPPLLPRDEKIMGTGRSDAKQMASYLIKNNKRLSSKQALRLANTYIKEGLAEGVNHDIAFSQMCHETGCLQFGNLVEPHQNNFAGIGATGPGQPGHSFPTIEIGVRAQIQHLKAYASKARLNNPKVDPRFDLVKPRGRAPTLYQLSGTWAADRKYHEGLKKHLLGLFLEKNTFSRIAQSSQK